MGALQELRTAVTNLTGRDARVLKTDTTTVLRSGDLCFRVLPEDPARLRRARDGARTARRLHAEHPELTVRFDGERHLAGVPVQQWEWRPSRRASEREAFALIGRWRAAARDLPGDELLPWTGPLRSMPVYLADDLPADVATFLGDEHDELAGLADIVTADQSAVIHGDTNPGNLMVCQADVPFLIDWDTVTSGPAWADWCKPAAFFGWEVGDLPVRHDERVTVALAIQMTLLAATALAHAFAAENPAWSPRAAGLLAAYRRRYAVPASAALTGGR